jgi:hypothetical protein
MRLYVKSIYDKNIVTRMFSSTEAPRNFLESIELAEKVHTCMDQLKAVGLEPAPKLVEFSGVGDTDNKFKMSPIDKLKSLSAQSREQSNEIRQLKKENAQLLTQKAKIEIDLMDRVAKLEGNHFTSQPKQYSNKNDRYSQANNGAYGNRSGGSQNNRNGYRGDTYRDGQGPPTGNPRGLPQSMPPELPYYRGSPGNGSRRFNGSTCSYCHRVGHQSWNCWTRDPTIRPYRGSPGRPYTRNEIPGISKN